MKTFLATDGMKLNDTFKKTVETVVVVKGSGFVREGDQFNTYAQFNQIYGEMAGVSLRNRAAIEKYLSRIGLYFIDNGDIKTIVKVGDEVGDMLYDFYLRNDEPAITRFTTTWRDENRENINKFLQDKPWEKIEDRLRYSDYGLSRTAAGAIFIAKPETRLFEVEKGEYEINLPEGSLWKIDEKFLIRGLTGDAKRANITCDCGKKMKLYEVKNLENGRLSCQSCGNRTTDFNAFYKSIADEEYTVIKDFEDARPTTYSRIVLQCPDKAHQPYSTYQNKWMNQGARCPACSQNHVGEQKVREFLQSKNIPYKDGVRFDGLIGVGGKELSYDFQIELNGKSILLEIDGAQHFSPRSFGRRDINVSEQAYQQQVEHDRRKTNFALQNSLRLVRIQNVDANYDFILNSLEAILNGSTANHFGDLYQKEG